MYSRGVLPLMIVAMTKQKPNQVKESVIERDLVNICKEHDILCIKVISSAHNGIPDRVLIGKHAGTGEGVTAFVEVKRPGGKPRALQRKVIADMVRHGATVAVSDTKETNRAILAEVFGVTVSPKYTR